jgi:hypothetical protein
MSDLVVRERTPEALPRMVAQYVVDHLTQNLQGKRYVTVAGGTAIASALGYSVREVGMVYHPPTEFLPGMWEATAEVLDPAGLAIGRGTGVVADDERPWNTRPLFARRAMASTRAAGRALRLCLGHLFVGLGAGFTATTLEEMPEEVADAPTPQRAATPPQRASTAVLTFEGEQGGRFTGVLVKVWEPKTGNKRIGFEVVTPAGLVKLGSFTAHHLQDGKELAGSNVEVAWKRSKCGKFLNLEGIMPITNAPPPPPKGDPDADIPF